MMDYDLIDGPLAGQTIALEGSLASGETIVVEVVDIDQGPHGAPRFEYVIHAEPAPGATRSLRYAADLSHGPVGDP